MTNITYDAPATCAKFMKSDSFGRLIAGPVGSGKTTACIFELMRRSCEQWPSDDGLRYTRWAITRQTLKQLKDTVLKDILAWLPGIATWKVSEGTVYIEVGDVRSEWLLIPLEDQEDQKRLLSSQLTGAWMSEAIEQDVNLVAAIAGRMPRYPSGTRGLPKWSGVIADTNFPSEGSNWHKFMEEVSPDWQIFKQPGGLTPEAENLDWLNQIPETLKLPLGDPERRARGRAYYERLARNTNPDWIRRYVHAQYGDDPSGAAVYRETFKKSFHVVDDVEPVYGHPLIIGQDFGRDPCSVICQLDHRGCMRVLQEVIAEDTGLELHLRQALRPALNNERYIGRSVAVVGDPSGVAKDSIYEETSFDVIKRHGFMAIPAPTNDIDPRIRAIEAFLLMQVDGGPGLIVDRNRCPTIVRALEGGYRYDRTKSGIRKPAPSKNEYSHPIDALQYACLAAHGGMPKYIAKRLANSPRKHVQRVSAGAWT
jgi:hypothetical protein